MSTEWCTQKISSLGEFDRGKSKHRPRDAAHLYGGPYPFIQTGDITNSGGRITTFRQTYSDAGLAQSRLWPAGTLAITIAANIAETALLTFPACFPDSVVGFTAERAKADVRFIEYLFQAMRKQVKSHAYGSAQENINLEVLRKLEFPVPSLETQIKIADYLTMLDDRITLLRETNTTLEAIAQALFKSWFVDFDPVHAKMQGRPPEGMDEATAALFPGSFEESELGAVPKGWQVGTLGTLAHLNPESWSAKQHPERILYIDLANTKAGQIDDINVYSFDDAPSRARRVLRLGDVVVGTVRPANRSFARIAADVQGLTGSTGFAVLRTREIFDQGLVYIAATSDAAMDRLGHLADGGAYPAVRPEVVSNTPLVVAPELIRKAFGEVANTLFAIVGANQDQARSLADLRDTLLPRLISGQIQISDVQTEAEAA
jgi:type I restriction enzyme, S subunit